MAFNHSDVEDQVEALLLGSQMPPPREPKGSKVGVESWLDCSCTEQEAKETAVEVGKDSAVEADPRYPPLQMEETSGGGVQVTSWVLNGDSGPTTAPSPDQFGI